MRVGAHEEQVVDFPMPQSVAANTSSSSACDDHVSATGKRKRAPPRCRVCGHLRYEGPFKAFHKPVARDNPLSCTVPESEYLESYPLDKPRQRHKGAPPVVDLTDADSNG